MLHVDTISKNKNILVLRCGGLYSNFVDHFTTNPQKILIFYPSVLTSGSTIDEVPFYLKIST